MTFLSWRFGVDRIGRQLDDTTMRIKQLLTIKIIKLFVFGRARNIATYYHDREQKLKFFKQGVYLDWLLYSVLEVLALGWRSAFGFPGSCGGAIDRADSGRLSAFWGACLVWQQ